jgi:hypothetical protein
MERNQFCYIHFQADRYLGEVKARSDYVSWTEGTFRVSCQQNNLSVSVHALLKLPNAQWEADIGLGLALPKAIRLI